MATTQKRGDSYKITVSCGYDINGKQIRRTTTWTPEPGMTARQIEKELERQKVLFEEKCRTGQVLDGSIRFAEFAERWFTDYAEKQLRPRTLARYQALMPRINAAIGHIRLDRLQPHHLMAFYDNLCEEGVRADTKYLPCLDLREYLSNLKMTQAKLAEQAGLAVITLRNVYHGKSISSQSAFKIASALNVPVNTLFKPCSDNQTLSAETVRYHHRVISSILSSAVKWQVIFANPCDRADLPKSEHHEAHYLDEIETANLLNKLNAEPIQYRTMIKLLIYTGLRRGELCGLEWQDVDFDNMLLHIRRSSLYLPEKGVFSDETKNETSRRSIKISIDAISMLREFRVWQLEQRLKVGDQWHNTDRLFTQWNGQPIHPDTISTWFRNFVKRNGLPHVTVHSLRHTNATLLIAAGTNLQTVANRLGHANTTTTSKIYSHAVKSADAAAAETLNEILNPITKKA